MEGTGMISGAPVQQDSKKLWQYLASASACLLAVGVGTALAWSSPVLPKLFAEDSWLLITPEQGSWVGSLLALGAMVGAIPAGTMADKIGRKRSILSLSVPFLLSWAMITLANSVWMLYAARFIVGMGVGASCVLVPTYVSEIADTSTRGTLGALFQLFLCIGIVLSFVMGSQLSYTAFAIFCGSIQVLFIVTFVWMPESPTWLVGQRKKPAASIALVVLRGDTYDVGEELADLQREMDESSSKKSSIFTLLREPAVRRAFICSLGGMAFQQLSGINAVIFYTVTIFKAAGSSMDPDLAAIIVATVQLVMAIVAALIVDKAGRKPLLIFSSGVMSLSLLALGIYFRMQEDGRDVSTIGWLPLSSVVIFVVAFSIGFGPIPWMLMGELFTSETKAVASSVAVMMNWFLAFLVTKTFPEMKAELGAAITFWIFAGIMAAATVFTLLIIPETKGKSLQAIQDELRGIKNNKG